MNKNFYLLTFSFGLGTATIYTSNPFALTCQLAQQGHTLEHVTATRVTDSEATAAAEGFYTQDASEVVWPAL